MYLPEEIRKTLKDQQYLVFLECGETDISLKDVQLGKVFLEGKLAFQKLHGSTHEDP